MRKQTNGLSSWLINNYLASHLSNTHIQSDLLSDIYATSNQMMI